MTVKIYVGNLPETNPVPASTIERLFSKYGRVRDCWVARLPAGFAFVMMDDERDASDAIDALDGTKVDGQRIRVEISRTKSTGRGKGGGRKARSISRSRGKRPESGVGGDSRSRSRGRRGDSRDRR